MLDPTSRDQRLLRRLRSAGEAPLTDTERARAVALRDALAAALDRDAVNRAEAYPPDMPALPAHRDWTWRPALWRAPVAPFAWSARGGETTLSGDTALFHDCPLGEVGVRQVRDGAPPLALGIDVYAFRGTYLSLAVSLPEPARENLRRRHVIRVDLALRTERPGRAFARLNIRRGGVTSIVRELGAGAPDFADFDLATLKVDVARTEALWLDLILDTPAANAITIDDLVLSRMPRAEV